MEQKYHIAIIGLGYVGLPLALEFAKKYPVVGFDICQERIEELRNGIDRTRESSTEILLEALSNSRYEASSIKNVAVEANFSTISDQLVIKDNDEVSSSLFFSSSHF